MAMGKRRRQAKQASMRVAIRTCRAVPHIPLYTRLSQILDNTDFDGYVESLCQRLYADEIGRPGLPPGRYFRLLLIGWRAETRHQLGRCTAANASRSQVDRVLPKSRRICSLAVIRVSRDGIRRTLAVTA